MVYSLGTCSDYQKVSNWATKMAKQLVNHLDKNSVNGLAADLDRNLGQS